MHVFRIVTLRRAGVVTRRSGWRPCLSPLRKGESEHQFCLFIYIPCFSLLIYRRIVSCEWPAVKAARAIVRTLKRSSRRGIPRSRREDAFIRKPPGGNIRSGKYNESHRSRSLDRSCERNRFSLYLYFRHKPPDERRGWSRRQRAASRNSGSRKGNRLGDRKRRG